METLKKNANILIVAMAALLFILGIWGPVMGDSSTSLSFYDIIAISKKFHHPIPSTYVLLIFGTPLTILGAAAIRAFKQSFYPQVMAWICRIAAISIPAWFLYAIIVSEGDVEGIHFMLYVDILLAIAIAVLSFIFHKPARE